MISCVTRLGNLCHCLSVLKIQSRGQNVSYFGRVHRPSYRDTLLDEGDPTLEERLKKIMPENYEKVGYKDIGLQNPNTTSCLHQTTLRRGKYKVIKYSKNENLSETFNFEKMEEASIKEDYFKHLHSMALHYDIFQGLYGDLGFLSCVPLTIKYPIDELYGLKVERGNFIKVSESQSEPSVSFNCSNMKIGNYCTLVMSSLDGNLMKTGDNEVVHWILGNIPADNCYSNSRNSVVSYCPPFPARGTGFHRIVFVLYGHESRIDFSDFQVSDPPGRKFFENRNFCSKKFFTKYSADLIKPVGLAFYQTTWDLSVKYFFHKKLSVPEPVYEYDWPQPYHPKQTAFPAKKSFWAYLDRYKDRKELAEEVIKERLLKGNPFEEESSSLRLANVDKISRDMPTWWKEVERLARLRKGKYHNDDFN